MKPHAIILSSLVIVFIGCDSRQPTANGTKGPVPSLPQAQQEFCLQMRTILLDLDKAQAAGDGKAESAILVRALDQYKSLTDEKKTVSNWIGRITIEADKQGNPIAPGVLLTAPGVSEADRILFVAADSDASHYPTGQFIGFTGKIAQMKIEYLTPMEGKFFAASVSTRGEIGFDATGLNLRGLTKARILFEITDVTLSAHSPKTHPPATKSLESDRPSRPASSKSAEGKENPDAKNPRWVAILQYIFSVPDERRSGIRDYPRNNLEKDGSPQTAQLLLLNLFKDRVFLTSEIKAKYGEPDKVAQTEASDAYVYGPLTFFTKRDSDIIINLMMPVDLMECVMQARAASK